MVKCWVSWWLSEFWSDIYIEILRYNFDTRHYNLNSKQGYLDIHDPIKVVSFGPSLRYIIPPRNMEAPWPIADIEKIQILSEYVRSLLVPCLRKYDVKYGVILPAKTFNLFNLLE